MAIISLRAYNHEIEGMIDNGQLDEAVAHCRHILATFPKHIASYRLLGKTHLEQQRISDATDIFQRVLTAIPDDFISNVGMSIIREDENNLDAAIWHMELAYEAQPANIAIQDELRRLYGRRDGVQPPKVRMTRGALARMYAKGGLYDQAIAELRAAIAEDPNRPDLQVLLAQMFYQTSQRVEAVEICVNILKKIPVCLEANRILAVSLPEAEGSDAVKNYKQIVISMDPYYAFAEPDAISSEQVPENAVNIERLEWKSGIQIGETPNQPTWATSLGISMEKPIDENIPDWLKSAEAPPPGASEEKTGPNVSPFIWDTQEVEKIITDTSKPEGDLPDWMKDAGWKPATGEAPKPTEETKPLEPAANIPSGEDVEKAEIPDWLQGIAPEGILGEYKQEVEPKEDDLSNPWLAPHRPGPTDSIIQWLEEKKPETSTTSPAKEGSFTIDSEDEVPEWLKDIDIPKVTPSQDEKSAESTPAFNFESSALSEFNAPIESVEGEEENVFLQDSVEPAVDGQPTVTEPIIPPEVSETKQPSPEITDDIPDWLKEIAEELPVAGAFVTTDEEPPAETQVIPESEPAAEQPLASEETPLEEIPSAPEEAVESALSETAEALPDIELPPAAEWQATAEAKAISEEMSTPELPVTDEAPPDAEITTVPEEQPTHELESLVEEVLSTDRLVSEVEIPSPELNGPEEALPEVELPASTEEMAPGESTAITTVQPQSEQPLPAQGELGTAEPGPTSEPDAFAWLEGLVAEQAAKEDDLTTPASEGEVTPPDWVKLESESLFPEELNLLSEPSEGTSALPADDIPEWIKGLGEEPEIESEPEAPVPSVQPEAEIPSAEELPAWLLEMEPPEPPKETPVSSEEALEWKSEELPAWLKEITESEEVPPAVEVPPVEEIPTGSVEVKSEQTEEIAPPTETSQVVTEEPQAVTGPWIPEVEEAVQPVSATPVEAEAEPIPVMEELSTKTAEISPTVALEQAEVPVEMVPEEVAALAGARDAINQGQTAQSIDLYSGLIKHNYHLDEIIKDLQDALYRFPVDVDMWVTLGDAHYHSDDLQEALNAYTKAEELVR